MATTYTPTAWTRADALKVIANDPTTTQPVVPYNFKKMSNTNVFIWDTMPVRDLYNEIVSINGWSVIFTLTADRQPNLKDKNGNYDINKDWNGRHGRAYFAYWFSKDSKNWTYGGRVMKEGVSPTKAEWAGTPILTKDDGSIELYYTCVDSNSSVGATIAKVKGKLVATDAGVKVEGFTTVKSLFSADGKYYQTKAQFSGFNFRDPSPFIDPKDGKLYMFFEGNVAGKYLSHTIGQTEIGDVPPGTPAPTMDKAKKRVGCIGLAVATDMTGDKWELLPPLVTAMGVNDQTERPHFVYQDNKYYLFTISHHRTYAEDLTRRGPDGVYGFVSENLTGPYRPLNGSGLVLGNPSEQPLQTYSHYVMKNGLVTSYIDCIYAQKQTTDKGTGDYRLGGVEAPTVRIKLKNDQTFLTEALDYGYIPPTRNITVK